jgi:exosortase/archaeosortase family protein
MPDTVNAPTQNPPENPPQAKPRGIPERKNARRKTIKFVLVFMISVFVFFFGYEKVRWTKQNDWYLLQVAHSTTLLLNQIGYSCKLASGDNFKGREDVVRKSLEAFDRGEEPPRLPPIQPGESHNSNLPPLTPWEVWEFQASTYRATIANAVKDLDKIKADKALVEPGRSQQIQTAEMRIAQMKQREMGPMVSFVYKPSPEKRIIDLSMDIYALEKDASLPQDVREKRLGKLKAEKAQVEQIILKPNRPPEDKRDVAFSFIVIPDCGAVQPMAIFLAAILAFPASWWRRAAGALIGIPVLYWVNAFRLAFLGIIGAIDDGGKWFKFAHEYVWQGIYIVFVVALWMAWVEFIVRRRTS